MQVLQSDCGVPGPPTTPCQEPHGRLGKQAASSWPRCSSEHWDPLEALLAPTTGPPCQTGSFTCSAPGPLPAVSHPCTGRSHPGLWGPVSQEPASPLLQVKNGLPVTLSCGSWNGPSWKGGTCSGNGWLRRALFASWGYLAKWAQGMPSCAPVCRAATSCLSPRPAPTARLHLALLSQGLGTPPLQGWSAASSLAAAASFSNSLFFF